MTLSTTIDHLFAGGVGLLEPDGHLSGIFKRPVAGRVRIEAEGLVGDEQADRRVHGGPEKAVHHYAAENYRRLARAWPAIAGELVPGSLGENLSTEGMSETTVHLGDVYRLGTALVQVSQPRSPCWKISHRFGIERLSMSVSRERITGWYYRVLEAGEVAVGEAITLVERRTEVFSIDAFWQLQLAHRPDLDRLAALAVLPGLAPEWQRRLGERLTWLKGGSR